MAWWLPDSPLRAKCFSPEDRLLIAERVRKNDTGIQNKEFKVSLILSPEASNKLNIRTTDAPSQ